MPDTGFLGTEQPETQPATESVSPVEVADESVAQVVEAAPSVVEAQTESVAPIESEAGDVSSVVADEQAMEAMAESPDTFLEDAGAAGSREQPGVGGSSQVTDDQAAAAVAPQKDEVILQVEKILEDGLGNYYQHMPEDAKARFHAKGQEIAVVLAGMVRSLQLQVKRALDLIKRWLQTIPGVNKFFLEQETKIKIDRLLELESSYRQEAAASV